MTRRQADVLGFIKEFIAANNFSPTYREIAVAMGLNSLATIHKHLQCLKAEGRIAFSPNEKQGIRIVSTPADSGRFEFEGPHHLWDKKLGCYWVKEKVHD